MGVNSVSSPIIMYVILIIKFRYNSNKIKSQKNDYETRNASQSAFAINMRKVSGLQDIIIKTLSENALKKYFHA